MIIYKCYFLTETWKEVTNTGKSSQTGAARLIYFYCGAGRFSLTDMGDKLFKAPDGNCTANMWIRTGTVGKHGWLQLQFNARNVEYIQAGGPPPDKTGSACTEPHDNLTIVSTTVQSKQTPSRPRLPIGQCLSDVFQTSRTPKKLSGRRFILSST